MPESLPFQAYLFTHGRTHTQTHSPSAKMFYVGDGKARAREAFPASVQCLAFPLLLPRLWNLSGQPDGRAESSITKGGPGLLFEQDWATASSFRQ